MTASPDIEALLRAALVEEERTAPAGPDLADRLLAGVAVDPATEARHGARAIIRRRWFAPALAVAAVLIVALVLVLARLLLTAEKKSLPARPLPSGFTATDVQFVDEAHGWVAGHAPCGSSQECPALGRTTDGGQTWSALTVPSGLTAEFDTAACAAAVCFPRVAFGMDGVHGYAWTPTRGPLFITSDGGRTWATQPQRAPIDQLVIVGDSVVRQSGTDSGTGMSVAPLGSAQWRTIEPWGASLMPNLVVAGNVVYALTSGPQYAWLFRSDDGRTWTRVPSTLLSHNAVTFDLGPLGLWYFEVAPDGTIAIQHALDGRVPSVSVSTDGGRSFGAAHPVALPAALRSVEHEVDVAAASDRDLVETVTLSGGVRHCFVSHDGGATWTASGADRTATLIPGWRFVGDVGYRLASNGHSLAKTSDGGGTITQQPFGS